MGIPVVDKNTRRSVAVLALGKNARLDLPFYGEPAVDDEKCAEMDACDQTCLQGHFTETENQQQQQQRPEDENELTYSSVDALAEAFSAAARRVQPSDQHSENLLRATTADFCESKINERHASRAA